VGVASSERLMARRWLAERCSEAARGVIKPSLALPRRDAGVAPAAAPVAARWRFGAGDGSTTFWPSFRLRQLTHLHVSAHLIPA
jgi:hypothetical protein